MPSYHQMGHHSNNLIDLPEMSSFSGAIYSPINAVEADVTTQIAKSREARGHFEAILDPQMYVPATQRGKLREWSYFPKDVDTADLSSLAWWKALNLALSEVAQKVGANSLCSPIIIPKAFDDKFYLRCVEICDGLRESLADRKCQVIQTVLCGLAGLCDGDRALEVASIISKTSAERVYLIFVATTEPRREMFECDELLAAMRMIRSLEQSGIRVLVGFCSSDVVMWKAAGATSCASGKFFNLRRFTKERFEEPSGTGGGQLPYWFEEGLMAFLREPDLIRLRKLQLLSASSLMNPFSVEILNGFDEATRTKQKPTPWLGTGWRQFLYWFADVEDRLNTGKATTQALLRTADENWAKVEAAKVLMDERHNNGKWVRPWLNTLNDFGG